MKTGQERVHPVDTEKDNSASISLREYFAGLAMQGLCANSIPGTQHQPKNLAIEAVSISDALIAALNSEKNE